MTVLDRYPWCGHGAVMGQKKRDWQEVDYVLSWFGKKKTNARKVYRKYIQDGIEEERRDDLVGGGLVRTLGGWSQVVSLRKSKGGALCDERILGQDEFVERIISETDKRIKGQLSINERKAGAEKRIHEICEKEGVFIEGLKGGSRRGKIPLSRNIR